MSTYMRPGFYLYTDPIGGPPQRVQVFIDGEDLVARFPPEADDAGADLLVDDLPGKFEPED